MRRCFLAVLTLLVYSPFVCLGQSLTIRPTTTLAAQTSNNTSAAGSFADQSNGNNGAGNVSKADVHSLLYAGAQTKVYAHLVLWFGQSDHMNIGYSSTDPAQVKRQIDDMVSRGIEGVMMVWYGPNNAIDTAATLVMREAEKHKGFTFALMVDHGAILWNSCAGCTPQQALTAQLQYMQTQYFSSPAYLRWNGRPVVTNFDIDLNYTIDWNALSTSLTSQPAFIFQNSPGFGHSDSTGAYSWVIPTGTDLGIGYLGDFYKTGISFPSLQTWGASYKGFNDSLASWGANRVMDQQCGQTWLRTFSEINSLYSTARQLPVLQLVTWNDYEEGTEIESGIDNCLSVSASASGNSLQWSVSGSEGSLDHYTPYISTDGQNLMPLNSVSTATHTLDLCGLSMASGSYSLYVQAVGKPSVVNHMSQAVAYQPNCPVAATPTPGIAVSLSPASLAMSPGQPGQSNVHVAPQSGAFSGPVTLSCSGLPAGLACQFSPSVVTPGTQGVSSLLTFSASTQSAGLPHSRGLFFASWMLAFPLAGLVVVGERKRRARILILALIVCVVLLSSSCGGGAASMTASPAPSAGPSPGTYNINITGSSGSVSASATATVTIQ